MKRILEKLILLSSLICAVVPIPILAESTADDLSIKRQAFLDKTRKHIARVIAFGGYMNRVLDLGVNGDLLTDYLAFHDHEKFVEETLSFLVTSDGVDFSTLPDEERAKAKEFITKFNKMGQNNAEAFFNRSGISNSIDYRRIEKVADLVDRGHMAAAEFGRKMVPAADFLKRVGSDSMSIDLADRADVLWPKLFPTPEDSYPAVHELKSRAQDGISRHCLNFYRRLGQVVSHQTSRLSPVECVGACAK